MITLNVKNNICYLQSDRDDFQFRSLLNNNLTIYERVRLFGRGKKRKQYKFDDRPVPLYTTIDRLNNLYHFPRGLYTLLNRQLNLYDNGEMRIIDESTDDYRVTNEEIKSIDIANILRPNAPFSLRQDQILAVMKALYHKRGILQLPTGCFIGDTRVVLYDGGTKSFRELVDEGITSFDTVSMDTSGNIVRGHASNPRITKQVNELIRIATSAGEDIYCTTDHLIMMIDGTYYHAEDIHTGDFLMSSDGSEVMVVVAQRVQLDEPEPVYDITVDTYHNFAIDVGDGKGVVVHNSGKTEVMSAIITILESKFPDIKITVIEPTDVLVNKTTERFNKYELNAARYKDIRYQKNPKFNVLVAHPTSLLTDSEKDPTLLNNMVGVFWDECQHCRCETWKSLNERLRNCEYALGFSALAVSDDHIYETNLRILDADEVMIEGATGPVIVNISPKYYIENDILATPVILQLTNRLGRGLYGCNDWSKLRQKGIESESRTNLTAEVVDMFSYYDRRVLVLVGTKRQAYDIASQLALEYDLSDRVAISFGAGESLLVNPDGTRYQYDGEDIVSDFDNERFSILISTSHMDEGVDLSNLDVAVLASGGKKDRRVVQRIGRALRNNKSGKYAYIVDFFDEGSGVLENHSNLRMRLYRDVIQVPKDLIFQKVSTVESFVPYFEALEGMVEATPSAKLMDAYNSIADKVVVSTQS